MKGEVLDQGQLRLLVSSGFFFGFGALSALSEDSMERKCGVQTTQAGESPTQLLFSGLLVLWLLHHFLSSWMRCSRWGTTLSAVENVRMEAIRRRI